VGAVGTADAGQITRFRWRPLTVMAA